MNGDNAEERIHHSDQPDHKSDEKLSVKIIRSVFKIKIQQQQQQQQQRLVK
jgi:hypothetical protein